LAIKWTRVSENPAAHGYNVEDAEARPMKILVADDDRIAATVLAQTLRQWEFDVTVAADGAEALRHLQSVVATPMLAILDWMMPQLEGRGRVPASAPRNAVGEHVLDAAHLARKQRPHHRGARSRRRRLPDQTVRSR
jgi:CheY-like chemotaxis protein